MVRMYQTFGKKIVSVVCGAILLTFGIAPCALGAPLANETDNSNGVTDGTSVSAGSPGVVSENPNANGIATDSADKGDVTSNGSSGELSAIEGLADETSDSFDSSSHEEASLETTAEDSITKGMNFTVSADEGNWNANATLEADGYTWNAESATLTLDSLNMQITDPTNLIQMPQADEASVILCAVALPANATINVQNDPSAITVDGGATTTPITAIYSAGGSLTFDSDGTWMTLRSYDDGNAALGACCRDFIRASSEAQGVKVAPCGCSQEHLEKSFQR